MFTKQRYDKNCTRILKDGEVVALIDRLANDRWSITRDDKRVTPHTFDTVTEAFRWWRDNHQTIQKG